MVGDILSFGCSRFQRLVRETYTASCAAIFISFKTSTMLETCGSKISLVFYYLEDFFLQMLSFYHRQLWASAVTGQRILLITFHSTGYNQTPSRNMYESGRGYSHKNHNSMGNFRSDENGESFGGYGQHNNSRRFGPRNNSDPTLYGHHGHQGIYSSHGQQPSYDTVGTASNQSHATDQWGNSTDPSSENSSVDKFQPGIAKQDLGETYGFTGFGAGPQLQGPILEELGQDAPSYGQPGYGLSQMDNNNGYPYQGNDIPPAVPAHDVSKALPREVAPGAPIKLGASSNSNYNNTPPPVSSKHEKRKSWLGRRFSRS